MLSAYISSSVLHVLRDICRLRVGLFLLILLLGYSTAPHVPSLA